ncbi:uncharacterized protein TNCV_4888081 [Trichonephila clavipes]|nr:uncharacterized protein TNCV_4888081 [Trichonephila clavipes]
MAWRHTNSPVRVKAKRTISTRKVMATVFWDRHGVLSFGWEQIDHPPYSSDMAQSDFRLFRYLKEFLGGKRFDTADEVKEEVQDWLSSQAADVYEVGIQKLVERYDKCLNKHGKCAKIKDEVEKVAYQLNEEAERTERPLRRLSKVMYGSTCADMQVDVMGECLSSIKHVVGARRNSWQTAGEIPRRTTQAIEQPISRFTVARRLRGGGLFARRPVRCTFNACTSEKAFSVVPGTPELRDNEWVRVLFTDESRFSLSSDSHRILIWREREAAIIPRTSLKGTRAMGLQFLFMDDNAPCHRTVVVEPLLESEDCHEFEPSTTEDPPCRAAMHAKSVES